LSPAEDYAELTELTGFVEDMQTFGATPTARLSTSASWRPTSVRRAPCIALDLVSGFSVFACRRCSDCLSTNILPATSGKVADNDLEAEPVFALLETSTIRLWSKLNTSWSGRGQPCCRPALQVRPQPILLIEPHLLYPAIASRLRGAHYRGRILIRFVTRLARRPRPDRKTGGP